MNKIIIFESRTDSLRTFARLAAEEFRKIGYRVLMADMNEIGRASCRERV